MLRNILNLISNFVVLTAISLGSAFANENVTTIRKDKNLTELGTIGSVTGRPLPRFVSLKSTKVNMRRGPGKEFRIDWVYNRKNLPVKIISEYLRWRKIEDFEGYVGWVHASLLSGKKSMIIIDDQVPLKDKPSNNATSIAYLQRHVLVLPKSCNDEWCKIEINNFAGWVKRKVLWGEI